MVKLRGQRSEKLSPMISACRSKAGSSENLSQQLLKIQDRSAVGERLTHQGAAEHTMTLPARGRNASTMPSPQTPQSIHAWLCPGQSPSPTRDRGQQQLLGRKAWSPRELGSSQRQSPPVDARRQQQVKPRMSCGSKPSEHVPLSHHTKCTFKG